MEILFISGKRYGKTKLMKDLQAKMIEDGMFTAAKVYKASNDTTGCTPWPWPTGRPTSQMDESFNWDFALRELEADPYGRNLKSTVAEQDPTGGSLNLPGKKADANKNRPWLFFKGYARALKAVSEVTTKGAEKYTPNGWVDVPNGQERYMDAFMRHLLDVAMDKKYDDGVGGIGTLHMAQVIWNLLSVLELQLREDEQRA